MDASCPGYLDLDQLAQHGGTQRELEVAALRNDDSSWRVITGQLGISRSACRTLWARAARRLADADVTAYRQREAVVALGIDVRGLPAVGRGVPGAIFGSRPGDPAWLAERDRGDGIPVARPHGR
jgi:hypothetical protein